MDAKKIKVQAQTVSPDKKSITLGLNCCSGFNKIQNQFRWMHYIDKDKKKVRVIPHLVSQTNKETVRVNFCPVCGSDIRLIELK